MPSDAVTICGFIATAGVGVSAPIIASRAQARHARYLALIAVLDAFAEKFERKRGRTEDCLVLWSRETDPTSDAAREALTQDWQALYELRDAESRVLMRFARESPVGESVEACFIAARQFAFLATRGLELQHDWDRPKVDEHRRRITQARDRYREASREFIDAKGSTSWTGRSRRP